MPSSNEDQIGEHPSKTPTTRRSNRARKRIQERLMKLCNLCDVAFWKEAINVEMDFIMDNNTWTLSDLPPGFGQKKRIDYFDTYGPVARISIIRLFITLPVTYNLVIHQMDVNTTFLNGDLEEEAPKQWHRKFDEVVLSSGFVLNQSDNTTLDLNIKLMPNTSKAVDQVEYSRVTGFLMYAMTSTRPNIAYAVEFEALAAAGKEAEWLRNLIYEIPLWPKPISPISVHCDSATTLAKVYCQIYNEKSRHLGVRHNMVRELIINGVIFVNFVRFQQNMTDHLTKGFARDLVHKSAIGMGLKFVNISNDETPNSILANVRSRIQCGKSHF
nr:zinc finger, CCHC-type [Tanacetum cinerariifolium]